jgi:hypothetical protein
MMKLCGSCKGAGCEACNFEGVDADMSFTRKKIVRTQQKLNYNEYHAKKERELNKIDKKNSREDF